MKKIRFMFLAAAILIVCCQALKAQPEGAWVKADSVNTSWYYMNSLVCSDSINCISLSASILNTCCTLVRFTSDGGDTWQDVYNDSIVRVNGIATLPEAGISIDMPDPGFAVVCHDSGLVSISHDTMKTWKKFETVRNTLQSYYMYDKEYGFKVISYYKYLKYGLEYTSDGGASWKNIEIPEEYKKRSMKQGVAINSDNLLFLWLDEENGYMIIKINAKTETWSRLPFPKYYSNMFFLDSLNGWLVVNPARGSKWQYIASTSDGGSSWENVCDMDTVHRRLNDIFFYDKANGIAVGNDCILIRTSDAGKTWLHDQVLDIPVEKQGTNLFPPLDLYQIGYLSHNSGLIRGLDNKIYRYVRKPVSADESYMPTALSQPAVYPNPTLSEEFNRVKIKLPLGIEIDRAKISIFNCNGSIIGKMDWISNDAYGEINLEYINLQASRGVYYIKIETEYNIWHLPVIVY